MAEILVLKFIVASIIWTIAWLGWFVHTVEAAQTVGVEQAKALEKAEVKVIANSGTATGGISSLGDLFTSQGGTNIGALLEGLAQTPIGKELMDKLVSK